MKNIALLCAGAASLLLWSPPSARAQNGPPSAVSWHWPLYEPVDSSSSASTAGYKTNTSGDRLIRGTPRPNVWGSNMGFEEYSDGVDLHPGIDIRGERGDIVEVPLTGDVVYIQGRAQCREGTGDKCRMFIRSGDFLYYMGHFSMEEAPNGTMVDDLRELVQDTKYDDGPPDSARTLTAGTQVGQLENYRNPTNWDHLHISLFDVPFDYDNIDPLRYLSGPPGTPENVVSGDEGSTLTIVDDERPFVGNVEFVADGGTVNSSSVCGQELAGNIDIHTHMVDTFYTSRPRPNDFPGRDTWNDTIGIAGARYFAQHLATGQTTSSQWYESPLGCTDYACGAWRARFPTTHALLDRDDLTGDDDVFFAGTFLDNGPPVFIAGDVAPQLFDVARSAKDHSPADGDFEYVHILTNRVNENSVAPNGSWATGSMPDGTYVVTVEAWDNAGNRSARATNVNVRNTSAPRTGPNWSAIYAKDHDDDRGQIPSNLGGEPFWASPDILVIPASEATPSVSSSPRGTKLVVGETYNVYVRAHNPGCTDTTGGEARVWIATPGTDLGNFVSLGDTPTGTIPAEGAALLGPISWTPTAADLDGANEGHRCLIAQLGSDNEPLPASTNPATLDPVGSSKVVQRNVQTQELEFWVRNVAQNTKASHIQLELEGFGSTGRMQMIIERTPEMEAAWDPLCATYGSASPITCFHYENWYVLEVHADMGVSPEWPMAGVTQLDARILYELPDGASGKVTLTHYLDGAAVGGMIFTMAGATIIR